MKFCSLKCNLLTLFSFVPYLQHIWFTCNMITPQNSLTLHDSNTLSQMNIFQVCSTLTVSHINVVKLCNTPFDFLVNYLYFNFNFWSLPIFLSWSDQNFALAQQRQTPLMTNWGFTGKSYFFPLLTHHNLSHLSQLEKLMTR